MTASPQREIGRELSSALHDSTGGYELVIGALAAAGFGFLIDWAFGTVPLFTVIFAVLGFAGATLSLFFQYKTKMAAASGTRAARVDRTETSPTEGATA